VASDKGRLRSFETNVAEMIYRADRRRCGETRESGRDLASETSETAAMHEDSPRAQKQPAGVSDWEGSRKFGREKTGE